MTRSRDGLAATVAVPVGVVAAAALAAVTWLRRSKGLHPKGVVVGGTIQVEGAEPALGGDLGRPMTHRADVRISRSAGLPSFLPDVQGVALRWHGDDGRSDVLLASTGLGRWSRFVLVPRRRLLTGPTTSLMPFRGPRGPVLLGLTPTEEPHVHHLTWSSLRGPWQRFGTLTLDVPPSSAVDRPTRFDPVLHVPAGLDTYGWAANLRTYSYRWARRAWRSPDVADVAAAPVGSQA